MIYDCFIFNDELNLLQLRLLFLYKTVDRFVLVESGRTLSGNPKRLHYEENKEIFNEFHDKIIHLVCPVNNLPAWDYEYFQRNYIKKALQNCSDTDIIFISDADEIINVKAILTDSVNLPALIELPMFYYFVNLRTNKCFFHNLVAHWSFLKDKDIGNRYQDYAEMVKNRIPAGSAPTGWHFSYLYGFDITKYRTKMQSFSHQEFNTAYYLNEKRIYKCVRLSIDLYERPDMKLKINENKILPLISYLQEVGLELYIPPNTIEKYFNLSNLLFLLKVNLYRKIKFYLQRLINK